MSDYVFDPNASESEQRQVVEDWHKAQEKRIADEINKVADYYQLSNVPAIEKDFREYANEHVYGECLPDVDEMMYGHSQRKDVHELPYIDISFIKDVAEECLTYDRWETKFMDFAMPKVYPLLADQFSEKQVYDELEREYDSNPAESVVGIIDVVETATIITKLLLKDTSASENNNLSDSQEVAIENYVQDCTSSFLKDLGIKQSTYDKVSDIPITQLNGSLVWQLSDLARSMLSDDMTMDQFLNTSVVQGILDVTYSDEEQHIKENLLEAVLEKIDKEIQNPETYMYIRQHANQLATRFDYMVCYLQDEIDLDAVIENVFPELEEK